MVRVTHTIADGREQNIEGFWKHRHYPVASRVGVVSALSSGTRVVKSLLLNCLLDVWG